MCSHIPNVSWFSIYKLRNRHLVYYIVIAKNNYSKAGGITNSVIYITKNYK